MHGCRRGAVALVLALIAGLVAPSAAFAAPKTTTSKPTPTTTTKPSTPGPTTTTLDPKSVPPPPAFGLPLDLGLKLLAQRDEANKDIFTYSAALPVDQANERAAEVRWKALQRKLDKLRARVRETNWRASAPRRSRPI